MIHRLGRQSACSVVGYFDGALRFRIHQSVARAAKRGEDTSASIQSTPR